MSEVHGTVSGASASAGMTDGMGLAGISGASSMCLFAAGDEFSETKCKGEAVEAPLGMSVFGAGLGVFGNAPSMCLPAAGDTSDETKAKCEVVEAPLRISVLGSFPGAASVCSLGASAASNNALLSRYLVPA
jgi:hypothetical protein